MKSIIKNFALCCLVTGIAVAGCKDITDFGYNAVLSGKVIDQNGVNVSGNLQSSDLVVRALGENDQTPIIMRVKGDGTYQNTKLYPQSYNVWLEGAFIESPTQGVNIDLTGNIEELHDFVITPYIDCSAPVLNGSPTASKLTINYSVSGNSGKLPEFCVVFCSTIMYPSAQSGTGPGYTTLKETINNTLAETDMEGTVDFLNLESGTKYYLRIGSRAVGSSSYNYSDQLIVIVP